MNISQPVASTINAVDFTVFPDKDVHKISAKRITNPIALDGLLHPTPGGLHDLALGSFLDNACATCGLLGPSCPGHCGHIELPAPVYHCTYIDQMYKLLRAQCYYCHRLRLSRAEASAFWAKLQLLRHGLLDKAKQVDDIGLSSKSMSALDTESDDEENKESDEVKLVDIRKAYVKKCLKEAGIDMRRPVYLGDRTEAVAEARKQVLVEFHREITYVPKCRNCGAFSAKYRKNKATSIFRKPLPLKEKAKNAQAGVKTGEHPLELLNKLRRQQEEKRRRHQSSQRDPDAMDVDVDEGIADMETSEDEIRVLDGPSTMEMEIDDGTGEAPSSDEGEDLVNGDGPSAIAGEASSKKTKAKSKEASTEPQVYVNASEVHALLTHLFDREKELFSQIYGSASVTANPEPPSADMFFLRNIVVTPNRYRKEQKGGTNDLSESPDNAGYRAILSVANEVVEIQREIRSQKATYGSRVRSFDDMQNAWIRMQDAVNSFIDKEKNPATGPALLRVPDGIKQKLEKKEGLFRMNIMGKRVNFAARSVISPDPNIESNEIGVPPVFAKKLTYPEPVTQHNFTTLREAVIRGPHVHPGAQAVEFENGQVLNLAHKNAEERLAIANMLDAPSSVTMTRNRNKKVHRHLIDGDILIMNRQPTLHKPSMMCHRAKVLKSERTIRMHYANCKTYNADFDGDEMNMHFPQNELARTEALHIADNDHQYLSATAGEPLRGLIQDHISISVALTSLDTFLTWDEYCQLVYSCLRPEDGHIVGERIKMLEPDMLKPVPRWTGKSVISTILQNITPPGYGDLEVNSKSSVKAELWGRDSEEGLVRVQDSYLLTGVLDKKQIGPAAGGLIHAVYETYGHEAAGKFLSILGRLLTRWLNVRAFSCGVEDLVLTKEGETARKKHLKEADAVGLQVAAKFVTLQDKSPRATNGLLLQRLEQVLRDDPKQAELDALMSTAGNTITSGISSACLPHNLIKQFPQNQMQVMTGSGAKGSVVNANLISCNLGQQTLEGRRVPTMVSGKTLPTFRPFDSSLRAGGYITDRFLTGVRPQEYYFHAMAGREGLIDTAVKTSRSGYLQRCLIKGMEGLRADYDGSVRDADGTMVQTLYGEDGLDITKQAMLTDFDHMTRNRFSTFESLNMRDEAEQVLGNCKRIWDEHKSLLKKLQENPLAPIDPIISRYSPASTAGSVSEKFYQIATQYYKDNKSRLMAMEPVLKKSLFDKIVIMRYLKAIVDAGEAVGVVAGQSLGEPSTQMTLNTFHLAGHSAKNVTLGIPRLREILMTASMNIKTPTMQLYFAPDVTPEGAMQFSKGISRLKLSEVIDSISVKERVGQGIYAESRMYDVQIKFWAAKDYAQEYAITIEDVARAVEQKFLPLVIKYTKAELKKRGEEKSLKNLDAQPEVGKASAKVREEQGPADAEAEGGDSDDESIADDDATDAKKKKQQDEGQTYEDPDEEEEELAADDPEEEDESEAEDEGYGGSPASSDADEDSDSGDDAAKAKSTGPTKLSTTAIQERQNRILNKFASVTSFDFDKSGGSCALRFEYQADAAKLLLLSIAQRAAHEALVQSIPGIASAVFIEPSKSGGKPGDEAHTLTEGCNLRAMHEYQHVLEPHRIQSNSVGDMLRVYGVEAARETIIRELRAVFGGHNIDVDARHLTLVADYMTRKGGYAAFNRIGMADKTSPFMKMSFETTFGVLKDAVFDGDRDHLDTPSGRITVGKIGRMGTGMCDVLMPVA